MGSKVEDAAAKSTVLSETEIRDWCIDRLAAFLDLPPTEIDPDKTLSDLGLDSANSVHFVIEIEAWLGIELTPEVVDDYPTVSALAAFLVRRLV